MDEEKHAEFLQSESRFSMSAMSIMIIGLEVQSLVRGPRYGTEVEMVGYLSFLVFIIRVYLRELRSLWSNVAGMETCIFSTIVAITAYAQLLVIDASYIIGSPVLAIIIVFIVALCTKFSVKGDNYSNKAKYGVHKVAVLMFITVLPCSLLWWERLMGDRGGSFVLSHFLLFLSSALGAVAVMVSTLAVAGSRAGAQVLQLLHKTCTVVLTVTMHTMAAERLGEDMVLVCMPELFAVLQWFTIHSDLAGYMVILYRLVTSQKSRLITLSSAVGVLAFLFCMYGDNIKRVLVIFCSSAALSFFDLCMLRHWPGSTSNSKGPIQLLQVSTRICSGTAAMMAAVALVRWVSDQSITVLEVTVVLAALLLAALVWNIVCRIDILMRNLSILLKAALGIIELQDDARPVRSELGSASNSKGPIQLLQVSTFICSGTIAMMVWVILINQSITVPGTSRTTVLAAFAITALGVTILMRKPLHTSEVRPWNN